MAIVPKLNYLFSMLPLNIPVVIFKTIDKIIKQFIWASKKARINLKRIQAKKEYGGLGMPDIRAYQEAFSCAQTASILDEKINRPTWVDLEAEICAPFDPALYVSQCPSLYSKNPIISNTLGIWHQLYKKKGLHPFLVRSASLWQNPNLKIGGKMFFLARMALSRNSNYWFFI